MDHEACNQPDSEASLIVNLSLSRHQSLDSSSESQSTVEWSLK